MCVKRVTHQRILHANAYYTPTLITRYGLVIQVCVKRVTPLRLLHAISLTSRVEEPQHLSATSAQLHQQQRTDSVNGQIYSNTFHAGYSRAPLASSSEVGRPSTTAKKEAKSVMSDSRHPSHFHTTLKQYHSKCAATQ